MSQVSLLEFEGNPNIGMHMFANDKFCLIGPEVKKEIITQIEEVLQVPIYKVTTLATNLIGVFVAGNNEMLIIPELYDYEEKEFKKICEAHEVDLHIISEKQNTFGNNLCLGEDKIIVNGSYNKSFLQGLADTTQLNVVPLENKEFNSAGAIVKQIKGKFFVSQEVNEEEVQEFINEITDVGTVNGGSNFVSSGIIGNSHGLLLGSASTTIEIQKIVEAFDFL